MVIAAGGKIWKETVQTYLVCVTHKHMETVNHWLSSDLLESVSWHSNHVLAGRHREVLKLVTITKACCSRLAHFSIPEH